MTRKTAQEIHDARTFGQKAADAVARALGSWTFIIASSTVISAWITLNLIAYTLAWDSYPFILLNLVFSAQAFYAAPVIMMSQNRQSEKDRIEAEQDYRVDEQAERDIAEVKENLMRLEKTLTELMLYLSH